jgi:hypothetical protein
MANWKKLDNAFYDVVNNLTDRQWQLWREQQYQNKIIRQNQKEMEMKSHLLRLSFASFKGQLFLTKEFVESIKVSNVENIEVANAVSSVTILNKYALAA